MSGIQNVSLRIPEQWNARWFERFITEVLAKADVRNALGSGVTVSADGNNVATLTAEPAGIGPFLPRFVEPVRRPEAMIQDILPYLPRVSSEIPAEDLQAMLSARIFSARL